MGVVEANHLLAGLASLALGPDDVPGVEFVAVTTTVLHQIAPLENLADRHHR